MKRKSYMKPDATIHANVEDTDSWLVSYADMITLLLGLFVMLYSFSRIDDDTFQRVGGGIAKAFGETKTNAKIAEVSNSEARQVRAMRLLAGMLGLGQDGDAAASRVEQAAATRSAQEAVKGLVGSGDNSMLAMLATGRPEEDAVIELAIPDRLLFKPGTAEVTRESAAQLATLTNQLRKLPGILEIEIKGHTDSNAPRSGPFRDNWGLSSARAGAVAELLIKQGLSRSILKTSGRADLEPLFPETDARGRPLTDNKAKNRRVELIIRKKVDETRR